ncbi:MAG: hypothetical protein WDO69_10945 [Pseudomonadota bacterium]
MLTALARSTRALIGATFTVAVLAFYTGCGDQSTERNGGGDIPDLTAGSGASAAEGGAAGAQSDALVPWCDAYKIVSCVCQQCHQNPTLNGAAMPLMTYEDTQAPFPLATSSTLVWQKMQAAVSNRSMPDATNPSVVPPVKPLTDAQRNTLLDWFAQGAHDEGGRDCPKDCDWSKGPPPP